MIQEPNDKWAEWSAAKALNGHVRDPWVTTMLIYHVISTARLSLRTSLFRPRDHVHMSQRLRTVPTARISSPILNRNLLPEHPQTVPVLTTPFDENTCGQVTSPDGTLPLPTHVGELGRCSRIAIVEAEDRLAGTVVMFWQSVLSTLDDDDVQAARRLLPPTRVPVLHLCLTSGGGNASAAVLLGDALRAACERLIVHVPEQACSAATILAMHGDEIRMAPGARLSAVDGTFTYDEKTSLNEVEFPLLRQRAPAGRRHRPGTADGNEHLFDWIGPTRIAHAVRAQVLGERLCQRALRHIKSASRRRQIIHAMLHGCPTHGYPINQQEAHAAGLNTIAMSPGEQHLMLGLHDLHLSYGRMHRVICHPHRWRETTMRSVVGTSHRTAALVLDGELGRDGVGEPWKEIWRNHGWRELVGEEDCPRMAVELNGHA